MTNKVAPNIGGNSLYDDAFYNKQVDESYKSAIVFAQHLFGIFKPQSVIDFGCGRGAWLKAFREAGARTLVGLDGGWNSQEKMLDQEITFVQKDLNKAIELDCRYDLAISLEVAEHLQEDSAETFVKGIVMASDVVIFGAAYIGQGGVDHINEQTPTYWERHFRAHDYLAYDVFRPIFWGAEDVKYWYQQNTFLYVNSTSIVNKLLRERGFRPISNVEFMECVHPVLFRERLIANASTYSLVKEVIRRVLPSWALSFGKMLIRSR